MDRVASVYDRHPWPIDRTRWARTLGAKGTDAPDDDAEAWTLLADGEAVEERLKAAMRDAVPARPASAGAQRAAAPERLHGVALA